MKLDYAHLALSVRDMEKSIAFYTKVFGFTKAFSLRMRRVTRGLSM